MDYDEVRELIRIGLLAPPEKDMPLELHTAILRNRFRGFRKGDIIYRTYIGKVLYIRENKINVYAPDCKTLLEKYTL